MRTYEHNVFIRRGRMDDEALAMLANLGADGWKIVTAYAVEDGTAWVHHYVLTREIDANEAAAAPPALPKGNDKSKGRGR